MTVLLAILFGAGACFATAAGILATMRYHDHLTCDWLDGVQKVHARPAPRAGGICLAVGLTAGAAALPGAEVFLVLLIAGLPALLAGLAEDLTGRVSPGLRLAATLLSGLGFALGTGHVIGGTGLALADWALSVHLIALCFTAFAVAGIANAINLIDGFHGLAAGTLLIILAGLGGVAALAGDAQMLGMIAVSAGVIAAFLLFNFPLGRIFLGDGGAYLAGLVVAGFAVALPVRNQEISPLIGLVALAYPVTETLTSIGRRRANGRRASEADGGHLHSLVHARVARPLASAAGSAELANPLTSVLIWPLAGLSSALTVIGAAMPHHLPAFFVLIVAIYLAAYVGLANPRRSGVARPLSFMRKAKVRRAA